ncbi:signal peptidase II [Candidatus Cyanaurora vandensis]|uniref:signal peptidase II n=1 Tax=Candidatus Cyanaurora vandensis TaxID=2714958 RepID=UPI00257A5B62|nr:signal peptidase II [Candidatus Cyanaurora vandensis]
MQVKNINFWLAALLALGIDQGTKFWVVAKLPLGETVPLWPGVFHLTHVTNRGAAFSLFAEAGVNFLPWVSVGVSLVIALYALLGPRLKPWEAVGYGLILGGAVGNGVDRVLTGAVVDFLDARIIQFAVFNVADVAINLGVACLLWASLRWEKT